METTDRSAGPLRNASPLPAIAIRFAMRNSPLGHTHCCRHGEGNDTLANPLGSMQNFGGAHGSVPQGSISLGGPITTEGGLIFIAGTTDSHIRAFNVETGEELWSAALPAAGNATPMTCEMNGKQYLVIAASGHQGIREGVSWGRRCRISRYLIRSVLLPAKLTSIA
jgi:Glucose dehydrogenase